MSIRKLRENKFIVNKTCKKKVVMEKVFLLVALLFEITMGTFTYFRTFFKNALKLNRSNMEHEKNLRLNKTL